MANVQSLARAASVAIAGNAGPAVACLGRRSIRNFRRSQFSAANPLTRGRAALGSFMLSAASMASASDGDALCKVADPKKADNIYAFRAFDIDGKLIDLEVSHCPICTLHFVNYHTVINEGCSCHRITRVMCA